MYHNTEFNQSFTNHTIETKLEIQVKTSLSFLDSVTVAQFMKRKKFEVQIPMQTRICLLYSILL